VVTRRTALISLAGWPLAAAAAKEFWDAKDPGQWTPEEIQQLLNQSPWAKPASVRFNKTAPGLDFPGFGGWNRYGGIGPGGDTRDRTASAGSQVPFQAVIRWESALPIRQAEKERSSEDAERFYIVGAIGDFPGSGSVKDDPAAREQQQAMLREFTKLERKGDSPLYLDRVLPGAAGTLFYFSRLEPITAANKEISFSTRIGPLEMKARFLLKDMMYRGKLEL
jgi:hypothetical protein